MITNKEKELISNTISKISPQASEFVNEEMEKQNVEVIWSQFNDLIIKVENESMIIYYGYSQKENDELLQKAKEILEQISSTKEVCFNVYGENKKLIKLIQSYPFQLDYLGYHMVIEKKEMEIENPKQLVISFQKDYINELATIFDEAYQVDIFKKNITRFTRFVENYSETDEVRLTLLNGKLIGAYIFDGDYIRDFVIDPNFQGKGYGKELLKIILKEGFQKYDRIFLRVEENNSRAISLYLKQGFKIISHCAEHTLVK